MSHSSSSPPISTGAIATSVSRPLAVTADSRRYSSNSAWRPPGVRIGRYTSSREPSSRSKRFSGLERSATSASVSPVANACCSSSPSA